MVGHRREGVGPKALWQCKTSFLRPGPNCSSPQGGQGAPPALPPPRLSPRCQGLDTHLPKRGLLVPGGTHPGPGQRLWRQAAGRFWLPVPWAAGVPESLGGSSPSCPTRHPGPALRQAQVRGCQGNRRATAAGTTSISTQRKNKAGLAPPSEQESLLPPSPPPPRAPQGIRVSAQRGCPAFHDRVFQPLRQGKGRVCPLAQLPANGLLAMLCVAPSFWVSFEASHPAPALGTERSEKGGNEGH